MPECRKTSGFKERLGKTRESADMETENAPSRLRPAPTRNQAAVALAMKALSHPRRVMIYEMLAEEDGGLAYGDLQAKTGLSISSLNHHLRPMRASGAVATRRKGAYVIYRADAAALAPHLDRARAI